MQLKEEVANAPKSFELICTSKEDLDAWHEGLRFLMDQTDSQAKGGASREAEDCAARRPFTIAIYRYIILSYRSYSHGWC